jgi:hypothetical protein
MPKQNPLGYATPDLNGTERPIRDLGQIQVPVRFGVYVALGGAAAWVVHTSLFVWIWMVGCVLLVAWYLLKGKPGGGRRRL